MTDRTCTAEDCETPGSFRATYGDFLCGKHNMRWRNTGTIYLPPPRSRTCSFRDCDDPVRCRGWCGMHYHRWHRTGTPEPRAPRVFPKVCTFEGCPEPVAARGWCGMHYRRWRLNGDPGTVAWVRKTGDDVTYEAVHWQVSQARGKASDHACEHCGQRAAQWAYDRSGVAEKRTGPDHRFPGLPYSKDLTRYMALCISCHKRFDLAAIKAEAAQCQR